MTPRVGIVGTGPTGLYALARLLDSPVPLDLTLLESQAEPGWGTPYAPGTNDRSLLANIASVELPPLAETLEAWLRRRPDDELSRLGVERAAIDDRAFFPRVVLGEYFRAQLGLLLDRAGPAGHAVRVLASHRVADAELRPHDILLTAERACGEVLRLGFDHVVLATGHDVDAARPTRPGVFPSPYPTSALRGLRGVQVGILGASLSALDALVTVAEANGAFLRDAAGALRYHPRADADGFRATLMSRKGLLPEADFYFPIPYDPNLVCTPEAVAALVASGRPDLLDATFELFREELALADPDYAGEIGLARLDADGFADAYFGRRDGADPFAWAAANLAEAKANYEAQVTVPWRYAILRMHEVIGEVVPHLSPEDLDRFHRRWKAVFVDDYATIPHESIERLLALRLAGRLNVLRLGEGYELDLDRPEGGARVTRGDVVTDFPAFIDATGQPTRAAPDLPLPTLVAQGAVRRSRSARAGLVDGPEVETGGVDLDHAFRPNNDLPLRRELHCLALPFLLHRLPFHQGLTSSEEIGRAAAEAVLARVAEERGGREDRAA